MNRLRKILLAAACTSCVILLAFFLLRLIKVKDADTEGRIILRYGDVNPEGNITVKTARYFAEQVSSLSNGRMEINVYPSGVLGDEMQSYQQIEMGALDFYRANSASLNAKGDMKADILSLPYLFRNREHLWRVLDSEIGEEILSDIQSSGSQMLGLFYVDEGERNLFMVKDSVRSLDELRGKRIRAMLSDTLSDTLSVLGAYPVRLTYAETYNALKKGEVDGAENPVFSYYTNKFYQAAPYYIRSGHMYSPGITIMSEITWNTLSDEEKGIIIEAAKRTEEYSRDNTAKEEAETYSRLKELGVTIIEITDKEDWRKKAVEIYPDIVGDRDRILRSIQGLK